MIFLLIFENRSIKSGIVQAVLATRGCGVGRGQANIRSASRPAQLRRLEIWLWIPKMDKMEATLQSPRGIGNLQDRINLEFT